MNTTSFNLRSSAIAALLLLPLAHTARGQGFSSGSTGAYGPMNITSNTTLNLPPDGIFHCTTINVAVNMTLKFNRNALNTPVYLLATGNVTITGTIDVSGQNGTSTAGGSGGPGGFDGGAPAFAGQGAGDGFGPGAGKRGTTQISNNPQNPGNGSYATVGMCGGSTNNGAVYGSPLLMPLVGGSGGGGVTGFGGGGGGGALLIASSTRIDIAGTGRIYARGGSVNFDGYGSGGGVRLVAPIVVGSGSMSVDACVNNGRVRIDSLTNTFPSGNISGSFTAGRFMVVFPNPLPRLDILEAAGTVIPEGTNGAVSVLLPYNSDTNRTVTLQARDFNGIVPVDVVLTPDTGSRRVYSLSITNTTANNPAQITVPVVIPVNTLVTINAWTR